MIEVNLSTASVYPENTASAFKYAKEIGYNGMEIMVWQDPVSQNADSLKSLMDIYQIPIVSIHAPCLLISKRVMGTNPTNKLYKSMDLADKVGAKVVVVHPPFKWQQSYTSNFINTVNILTEKYPHIDLSIENMFPLRMDRFFGKYEPSAKRMLERGNPGLYYDAFSFGYEPIDKPFKNFTLDISHCATAGTPLLELATKMGDRLRHIHFTDGTGASVDEHLVPGKGKQPCIQLLEKLNGNEFKGSIVVEISTRFASTRNERYKMLDDSLSFIQANTPGNKNTSISYS